MINKVEGEKATTSLFHEIIAYWQWCINLERQCHEVKTFYKQNLHKANQWRDIHRMTIRNMQTFQYPVVSVYQGINELRAVYIEQGRNSSSTQNRLH